jgi:CubicO group peptidase (beta-lactamase class C family)
MRPIVTLLSALALLAGAAPAAAQRGRGLEALLESARRDARLPGMAVATWRAGRFEEAAAGERALGSGVPVAPGDPFHIGSITKPLTATLAARLVERGLMRWDDEVGARLGPLIDMDPAYARVTLADLLAHRGGLGQSAHPEEAARLVRIRDLPGKRLAAAELMLSLRPAAAPRERYLYSNFSYVVAAAMIEQTAGRSFEELMREEVLVPLGLASAGFGAPGSAASIDAPRGHFAPGWRLSGPIPPTSSLADNEPFLRPAGGLHMSMRDLVRFGLDQLHGALGGQGTLLRPESYRMLHAGAGWARGPGGELHHDGTNLRWFALVRLLPRERLVIAIAANSAGDEERTRRVVWQLSERLRRGAR